ncbi:Methicillin resistance mecR1 protein [Symmachiella dynata]|uniref:M56 family metallopeptidase n=1 Tax=Symmachiella dynata TaxID=2527995 RepID=UPI001189352F|nr:M56 family metallopeptidase [Symmachiella dynata]QDT49579.1 Methicillin resistance mecR1 protein [Symmachiella dynata]
MMWWLTQHLILAAALTAVVFAITRWRQIRPTIAHALWLLVLIKLLVPPLVVWPWTPLPAAVVEMPIREMPTTIPAVEITSTEMPDDFFQSRPLPVAATVPTVSPTTMALAVWLAGAVVVVCWRSLQAIRLYRMVRRGSAAHMALQQELADAAAQLGIAPPPIRLVPGLAAPGVWCTLRPILLWPSDLTPSLSAQAIRGVLLHELAHLRRRDHLTAWLVLLGDIIWWWNPCYWITRRQLNENAELACDAWVTTTLPESRRDYANALVAFATPPARKLSPQPALGLHSTLKKTFTRRLTMIMDETRHPRHMSRWGICAIVLFGLAVLPAWSRGEDDPQAVVDNTNFTQASHTDATTTPIVVYIDRQGKVEMDSDALAYILALKEPNAAKPTRELHISADLFTENNDLVKVVQDFRKMGFIREQMTVRRKGDIIRFGRNGGRPVAADAGISVRSYPVADIVVGYNTLNLTRYNGASSPPSRNPFRGRGKVEVDFEPLIDAIYWRDGGQWAKVDDQWEELGGPGRITIDEKTQSLIIRATNEHHVVIANVLAEIRRHRLESIENYIEFLREPEAPKMLVKNEKKPLFYLVNYATFGLLVHSSLEEFDNLPERDCHPKPKGTQGGSPDMLTDVHTLMNLITEVSGIENWDVGGGQGTIKAYPANLSVIIRQTEEVHRQVQDLMSAMRKANLGRAIADGDKQAIREFTENYLAKKK